MLGRGCLVNEVGKNRTVLALKIIESMEKLARYLIRITGDHTTRVMTSDGHLSGDGHIIMDESMNIVEYHPMERMLNLLAQFKKGLMAEYGEELWRESARMDELLDFELDEDSLDGF